MAKRNSAKKTDEAVEPRVIVLAEKLGSFLGRATVAARKSLGKAVAKKRNAKASTPASKGRSGGVVDAPGKRHRKPPPQELFDPRLGEPMGKQMGQKNLKRGGR